MTDINQALRSFRHWDALIIELQRTLISLRDAAVPRERGRVVYRPGNADFRIRRPGDSFTAHSEFLGTLAVGEYYVQSPLLSMREIGRLQGRRHDIAVISSEWSMRSLCS